MRIGEAWRISRFPYREVAYRPAARSGYPLKGSDERADTKVVKRVLLAATVNKIFFAIFTAAGASFPFALYEVRFESISLSAALSLSLILYLGYLVLYLIQVLPSFVDAESFTPLRVLPMTDQEVSTVSFLSYLRTVDYILVLGISMQVLIVGIITASVTAGALMLLAAIINSVFATAIALWLTGLFRGVMSRGGRSSAGGALRLVLVALWGLGVMSVVFLFNLASLLTPYLDSALSQTSQQAFLLLAIVHPFSLSIVIARIAGSNLNAWAVAVSVASSAAYCCVAVLAARWSMKRIDSVGRYVSTGVRTTGRDARVVTRRPLLAYIVKDLRVASRNPSTGFLFALPIFETLAVIVPLASSHIVKMAVMLVASVVGGSFALFVAFLLASVEQARMDYGDVLPIGSATPTFAKTIVAVVSFLPTPVFLAAVSYGRLTYVAGSLIPFLMTLAVFAGCVGEVTVLRRFSRRSRVSIMTFGSGIGVGTALVLLPVVAYAMTYLSSKNHTVSLLACGLIASAELGLALLLARRSR